MLRLNQPPGCTYDTWKYVNGCLISDDGVMIDNRFGIDGWIGITLEERIGKICGNDSRCLVFCFCYVGVCGCGVYSNRLEAMWANATRKTCAAHRIISADSGTTISTGYVAGPDTGWMSLDHACSCWWVACLPEIFAALFHPAFAQVQWLDCFVCLSVPYYARTLRWDQRCLRRRLSTPQSRKRCASSSILLFDS